MSVGYGHLLTHRPVKFIARRSDIIVSSTLQLTLTPADKGYRPLDHALLSREQIYDWCEQRCAYRALYSETAKLMQHVPPPDDEYIPMKTFNKSHADNSAFKSSPSPLSRRSTIKDGLTHQSTIICP